MFRLKIFIRSFQDYDFYYGFESREDNLKILNKNIFISIILFILFL